MINLIEQENFNHIFTTKYLDFNPHNDSGITKCLVYRESGLCVGYVIFNHWDDQVEILMIGVKKEMWNHGIGSTLLREVKRYGLIITIEVRASNTNAIKFYEVNDFVFSHRKEKYYDNNEDGLYYIWKKN
jgi:ribosomal protein S18 acetylase RimI-like enzyme